MGRLARRWSTDAASPLVPLRRVTKSWLLERHSRLRIYSGRITGKTETAPLPAGGAAVLGAEFMENLRGRDAGLRAGWRE